MIYPAEPSLFWSDLALGLVTLICGILARSRGRLASFMFVSAAIAAWLGAFFHGYISSTTTLSGQLIWLFTLMFFAASSAALMQYSLGSRKRTIPIPVLVFVGYSLFAYFISDGFIWASILQGCADIVYGLALFRAIAVTPPQTTAKAILWYEAYISITAMSALIASATYFPNLTIDALTMFHLTEIPAVVLLYLSIRDSQPEPNISNVTARGKLKPS
jgi:hypothetical protein